MEGQKDSEAEAESFYLKLEDCRARLRLAETIIEAVRNHACDIGCKYCVPLDKALAAWDEATGGKDNSG